MSGRHSLLTGQWGSGTGHPENLWVPHPWRCPRTGWRVGGNLPTAQSWNWMVSSNLCHSVILELKRVFSLAPMCFLVSPYKYQYLWEFPCVLTSNTKYLLNQKGLPLDRHWGEHWVQGYWVPRYWKQEGRRISGKTQIQSIQSNQNLSHNCVFKEDCTEEIPRGGPSLHLMFWALHGSFPLHRGLYSQHVPQPGGFLYDSISSPVKPRWHPQKTVHPMFAQPILIAREFHLFPKWIQSPTTEITST